MDIQVPDAQGNEQQVYETLTPYSSSAASSPENILPGAMYQDYNADWHHSNVDATRQSDFSQYQAYMGYPVIQSDLLCSNTYCQSEVQGVHHQGLASFSYGAPDGMQSQMLSVSPATSTGSSGKPKRKRIQTPPQRQAANVRERRRMFHLNEAFDNLRKRLPAFNYEKRLSRIETLRLAITYISFMKDISEGEDPENVKLKAYKELENEFLCKDQENMSDNSVDMKV
ncbi:hypothetical protein KUTeg_008489 [Tegillarca granosa]|uniref:BHLH domain-containing protein n=1 Tax=Tegillarca granosa TaxID=220873 RepID=A0ABQ9F9B4_TEGGR|nr:hypothetical protein KUTeg_008489 [Tegillarca granosa]